MFFVIEFRLFIASGRFRLNAPACPAEPSGKGGPPGGRARVPAAAAGSGGEAAGSAEAKRLARRGGDAKQRTGHDAIQGEELEPIRTVERVLTRPDGTRVRVQVPVYPPFQLKQRASEKPPPRKAAPPRVGRKRSTG